MKSKSWPSLSLPDTCLLTGWLSPALPLYNFLLCAILQVHICGMYEYKTARLECVTNMPECMHPNKYYTSKYQCAKPFSVSFLELVEMGNSLSYWVLFYVHTLLPLTFLILILPLFPLFNNIVLFVECLPCTRHKQPCFI